MIVRFGDYEIDRAQVRISRRGRTIPVQPQVFAVIEHLLDNRDRVVTKEDLLDQVWGDRFVSESALTSRIKTARKALGDTGSEQQVIRTIIGRGYQFVAEIDQTDDANTSDTSDTSDSSVVTIAPPASSSPPAQTPSPELKEWPVIGRHREAAIVRELRADPMAHGVVVTGPDGIGRARFADMCRETAAREGVPTARVVGVRAAQDIPLAALAHLLPDDVVDDVADDDLARTGVHRRARAALDEIAGDDRLLISVENADALDNMSAAVISSLLVDGRVFVISVGSPPSGLDADTSGLTEIRLSPMSEADIDIALHRALAGPLDAASLSTLVEACGGRPALLHDIVETSAAAGTLVVDHGVWRLVGAPQSTATETWDPGALGDAARSGVEELALFGELPERFLSARLGAAALDELDRERLISVDDRGQDIWLSLADPLLTSSVRASLGPLRERRLKQELVETTDVGSAPPATIATLVSWGLPAPQLTPEVIIAAAQTAMIEGDVDTAGSLVEHVGAEASPYVPVVAAEVALRRSQWNRAETLFESIDVDVLDDLSTAHVLRRRATIRAYWGRDIDGSLELLDRAIDRVGERAGRSLRARRVGLLAYAGRTTQVLDEASRLDDSRGLGAIEVGIGTASAELARGRFAEALRVLAAVDAGITRLPAAWRDEPTDALVTVRTSALHQLGRIGEAVRLARDHLPVGRRTELGYFPVHAAQIELDAGRPKAAQELLRQAVASSHRFTFPQYLPVAEALAAAVTAITGQRTADLFDADPPSEPIADENHVGPGDTRWLSMIFFARAAAFRGVLSSVEQLIVAADEAEALGSTMRAADLLWQAGTLGGAEVATQVVDRVAGLAAGFDGDLWPIRVAHLDAVAKSQPLDRVTSDYATLGFKGPAASPS